MVLQYNKRRIVIESLVRFATVIILTLLAYANNRILNNYTLNLFWLLAIALHLYKAMKNIILKWKKPAIILTPSNLELPNLKEEILWKEISYINYKIGFRYYFLYIELIPKEVTGNNNKLITYYRQFLIWFNSGPINVNLEELEGEAKVNFDAIMEYKNNL